MTSAEHPSGANSFLSVADYAAVARKLLAPEVWDFIAGGAGREHTLAANEAAFSAVRLRPAPLSGAARPELSLSVIGERWSAPIGIAPLAYHRLVHGDGEVATAQAAGEVGVPFVVSTFASCDLSRISAATTAPCWLQLYPFRDWNVTESLVRQAQAAGFSTIVLTVDTPVMARRLRDLRNGFRIPTDVRAVNVLPHTETGSIDTPSTHSADAFDRGLDWSVVDRIRNMTSLRVVVKGVLTAESAAAAARAGADAVIVSNHGGRQLDGVAAGLAALPEVVAAVGGACPVFVDGGVRHGSDVVAALALGASAVFVGRPVLYALAAGGTPGVRGLLDLLVTELTEAMILTGRSAPGAIDGSAVSAPAEWFGPAMGGGSRAVAAVRSPGLIRRETLHGSVRSPLLDTMGFLNEITDRYPHAISFAPGRPYAGLFDIDDVPRQLQTYQDHLRAGGADEATVRDAVFQYGPTAGRIRELVARMLRVDENIDVPPETVVVTVGCQEAMILVLRALFADANDVLLVDNPCYVGITGAARLLDIAVEPVDAGPEGLAAEQLRQVVARVRASGRRPRALYLVPDCSNPSGTSLPAQARHALLAAAGELGVLLLEDNPYGIFARDRLPTLKSLDRDRQVIYLGSFAKSAFPGARLGYVVADQLVAGLSEQTYLADELSKIKSMITVNTPSLSQSVVAGILLSGDGGLRTRNAALTEHYQANMVRLRSALERAFPAHRHATHGVAWNDPPGGFFLTLRVPFPADATALRHSAEDHGVIWTPMSYFYLNGRGGDEIRLSCSLLTADQIDEGVHRLAAFITSGQRRS